MREPVEQRAVEPGDPLPLIATGREESARKVSELAFHPSTKGDYFSNRRNGDAALPRGRLDCATGISVTTCKVCLNRVRNRPQPFADRKCSTSRAICAILVSRLSNNPIAESRAAGWSDVPCGFPTWSAKLWLLIYEIRQLTPASTRREARASGPNQVVSSGCLLVYVYLVLRTIVGDHEYASPEPARAATLPYRILDQTDGDRKCVLNGLSGCLVPSY